jgi:hypothetical protein
MTSIFSAARKSPTTRCQCGDVHRQHLIYINDKPPVQTVWRHNPRPKGTTRTSEHFIPTMLSTSLPRSTPEELEDLIYFLHTNDLDSLKDLKQDRREKILSDISEKDRCIGELIVH